MKSCPALFLLYFAFLCFPVLFTMFFDVGWFPLVLPLGGSAGGDGLSAVRGPPGRPEGAADARRQRRDAGRRAGVRGALDARPRRRRGQRRAPPLRHPVPPRGRLDRQRCVLAESPLVPSDTSMMFLIIDTGG